MNDPCRKQMRYSEEGLLVLRHHGFSRTSLDSITPEQATGNRVDSLLLSSLVLRNTPHTLRKPPGKGDM